MHYKMEGRGKVIYRRYHHGVRSQSQLIVLSANDQRHDEINAIEANFMCRENQQELVDGQTRRPGDHQHADTRHEIAHLPERAHLYSLDYKKYL